MKIFAHKKMYHIKTYFLTKLLKGSIFTTETYIYDNKVAILDYTKDILETIVESLPISSAQRAMFELTWNLL